MNVAQTILTVMLCTVCAVRGNQMVHVVHVGGDVPKPGAVNFEGKGMTIDAAIAKVGMDLGPYYAKRLNDNDGARCPIRVMLYRQGGKIIYNPSIDAAVIQSRPLALNDTITVTDFRQHPKKIEELRQRIEQLLELGSTEMVGELLSLATLLDQYDEWLGQAGAPPKQSVDYLKHEAARLVERGKGQKILGILELKLSDLQLSGLGHAHPVTKSTTDLIRIFRELVPE